MKIVTKQLKHSHLLFARCLKLSEFYIRILKLCPKYLINLEDVNKVPTILTPISQTMSRYFISHVAESAAEDRPTKGHWKQPRILCQGHKGRTKLGLHSVYGEPVKEKVKSLKVKFRTSIKITSEQRKCKTRHSVTVKHQLKHERGVEFQSRCGSWVENVNIAGVTICDLGLFKLKVRKCYI